MKKIIRLSLFLLSMLSFCKTLSAQVNYNANDRVTPFTDNFGYGANMGYYAPWTDEQLGDIAAGLPDQGMEGAGVNCLRPALFGHFLEQWGYDIRVSTFQHYQDIGMRNNVVFVGYPAPNQRDQTQYCPGQQSELYANLYADIWDGGANGTPVNEGNDYALYLYKTVSLYKDYVKFWEIWNEPDFDYSGKAWKPATMPDNWWNEDPDPCDYAIRAPAYHYIRMLRISYEIIKTLDPDAYVAVGGLGFPSFMDVILRNTDNPDGGKVSAQYPLKGGAYFDVLSFHSYPHIDGSMRSWSDAVGGFVYTRHSDSAVDGMLKRKNEFDVVLRNHGYNGNTYPKKVNIITECNLPRKAFQDYIGTEESQINFIIKALVESQKNEVAQFHIYNMAEITPFAEARNEYDLMGLFQKIENVAPYQQKINNVGIAYRTTSQLLNGYHYAADHTNALHLPAGARGAAFRNAAGEYRYVLWATTSQDQSEVAAFTYTFPSDWGAEGFNIYQWDYGKTKQSHFRIGNSIHLTGRPVFISVGSASDFGQEILFDCTPNPFIDSMAISIYLPQSSKVNLTIWDHQGKHIKTFAAGEVWDAGSYQFDFSHQNLPPGLYICRLETKDRTLIRRLIKVSE